MIFLALGAGVLALLVWAGRAPARRGTDLRILSALFAALAAVGVEDPARAVFVGDRRFDDIHGAKAIGMRAVLVPHSDIPDEQRGHVEGEPDAVITRLADLLPIVDSWR